MLEFYSFDSSLGFVSTFLQNMIDLLKDDLSFNCMNFKVGLMKDVGTTFIIDAHVQISSTLVDKIVGNYLKVFR